MSYYLQDKSLVDAAQAIFVRDRDLCDRNRGAQLVSTHMYSSGGVSWTCHIKQFKFSSKPFIYKLCFYLQYKSLNMSSVQKTITKQQYDAAQTLKRFTD